MTIAPGENVGPYRVIEQLGSGGMATVFKAYHASLDRYVAIKILHPAFKADPQFFERFKREARIVANLEHPNIIPVYDFNEHKGEPYLVMRFVEGDTLKPRMKGQPMPANEVLHLMRPTCQALNYAHNQGVLHRDIKPSNIMVTEDDSIFITDFGLARMVEAGESTLSQDMMVGTPQYISPEQAQGMRDLDGRTDIYSLGVVLFEMIIGRVPFNADTPFATVHDHIYTPLPLPSTINPDIDPAVERMLLKALAKEPDDRFATAADLLQTLETTLTPQIAAGSTINIPDVTPTTLSGRPKKRGVPWWAWAGSVALIVCLLGTLLAGFLLLRNRNQQFRENEPVSGQVVDNDSQPINSDGPSLPLPTAPPSPPPTSGEDEPDNSPPPQDFLDPESPEFQEAAELTDQGYRALEDGDFEAAAESFEQAVQIDPHNMAAYIGLSDALAQLGDKEGSIAVLQDAVANNPENPDPLFRLGEVLQDENPEAAQEAFEAAESLMLPPPPGSDPDSPEHQQARELNEQANQAMSEQNFEEAVELFEQAIQIDPHHLPAYFGLSEALKQVGEAEGSIAVLEEAVHNNPGQPEPWMRLGEVLLRDHPAEALGAFEEAAALDPQNALAYAGQGFALLSIDQDEAAKEMIDEALTLEPKNPEAHLANAFYLVKHDDRRGAVKELQQIMQNHRAPVRIRDRAQQLLDKLQDN